MWRRCDGAAEAHRTPPRPTSPAPGLRRQCNVRFIALGGGSRRQLDGGRGVREVTSSVTGPRFPAGHVGASIRSRASRQHTDRRESIGRERRATRTRWGGLVGIWRPFRGGTEDADGEPTAGMALSASSVCLYAVFQATGPPAAPDKKGGRWGDCCPCPVSSRHAEEQSGPSVIVRTLPCWTDILEGGRMCHRRFLDFGGRGVRIRRTKSDRNRSGLG